MISLTVLRRRVNATATGAAQPVGARGKAPDVIAALRGG